MKEEDFILTAGDKSEQALMKAFLDYIKSKAKYEAMLEYYNVGEPRNVTCDIEFPYVKEIDNNVL